MQRAGDSEREVYGRLYGTVEQLPPWAGRSGAYTPFECVEFGDTEILHDLEVTVRLHRQSGSSLHSWQHQPVNDIARSDSQQCALLKVQPRSALPACSADRKLLQFLLK